MAPTADRTLFESLVYLVGLAEPEPGETTTTTAAPTTTTTRPPATTTAPVNDEGLVLWPVNDEQIECGRTFAPDLSISPERLAWLGTFELPSGDFVHRGVFDWSNNHWVSWIKVMTICYSDGAIQSKPDGGHSEYWFLLDTAQSTTPGGNLRTIPAHDLLEIGYEACLTMSEGISDPNTVVALFDLYSSVHTDGIMADVVALFDQATVWLCPDLAATFDDWRAIATLPEDLEDEELPVTAPTAEGPVTINMTGCSVRTGKYLVIVTVQGSIRANEPIRTVFFDAVAVDSDGYDTLIGSEVIGPLEAGDVHYWTFEGPTFFDVVDCVVEWRVDPRGLDAFAPVDRRP